MHNKQYGVSIPQAMDWFKTMTTNEYIRGVKQFCVGNHLTGNYGNGVTMTGSSGITCIISMLHITYERILKIGGKPGNRCLYCIFNL
jgi:hypothetical protein